MPSLTRIDQLLHPDHRDLVAGDECYALREYTARQGFGYSDTNDLILNFKKSPLRKGTAEWKYKLGAIDRAARELRDALDASWLQRATLVPMPPSRVVGDPEYDDRLLAMLHKLSGSSGYDVRQLLLQTENMDPAHGGHRPSVHDLVSKYAIDEKLATPLPTAIGIFDDVLTLGTHFRAAKIVLQGRFGAAMPVVGLFVARAVYADDNEPTP